eukprot:m.95345 g.95345  ORF g.95345 m.95345 type:complete len:169 (+) comp10102_c0_seq1:132-638(+)
MTAKIAAAAVVSKLVEIVGDVTIGDDTVVHPSCKILAEGGPIVIGSGCLIEELVTIRNTREAPMTIGNGNVFEVGAVCEAQSVGDNNVIAARAHVGSQVTVSDRCVIGVTVTLQEEETLENGTVTWADSHAVGIGRRVVSEREGPGEFYVKQREQLHKIIPKFNELQT